MSPHFPEIICCVIIVTVLLSYVHSFIFWGCVELAAEQVWNSKGQLLGLGQFCFHHVGFKNQTEVDSFDFRHIYMLSHLASLRLHFAGVK